MAQSPDSLNTKNDWENYIEAGIEKAVEKRNADKYGEAESLLDELADLSRIHLGNDHHLEGTIYHQKGVIHYFIDQYDQAIEDYLEAIRIREIAYVNNHTDLANTHHNTGIAYRYTGQYSKAIPHFEKAIAMREALQETRKQAQSYNQLGIIYENLADFDRALECSQLALDLFRRSVPENEYGYVAQCHRDMGIVYRMTKRPAKALEHFHDALEILRDLYGETDRDVADCYNNIGTAYWSNGEHDKAEEALKKSLSIYKNLLDTPDKRFFWNYNNLGLVFLAKKDYTQSKDYLNLALEEGINYYGDTHPEIAKCYENLGDVAFATGDYQSAMALYQKAVINSFSNFRDSSVMANPDFSQNDLLVEKSQLLSFLSNKAKSLIAFNRSGKGPEKYLESAYETCLLADELIDLMQRDFREEGSVLILLEKAIPMYEHAISASLGLAGGEGGRKYKEEAFRFAEKSKAVVLLGSIKELKAKEFAGIPQEILEEENSIRQELAFKENLLVNAIQIEQESGDRLAELRNDILKIKQTYERFTTRLEEEYPSYHNLKYGGEIAGVNQVRDNLLDENTVLIEYFIGNEKIYIFTISKTEFEIFESEKSILPEQDLLWLIDFISKPQGTSRDHAEFVNKSQKVFSALMPSTIPVTAKKLIIIPDGILSYLPFDILLTREATGISGFKKLPYLAYSLSTGYGYSATTLIENRARKQRINKGKVLGMAPVFEESPHFRPLIYSQAELSFLDKNFRSTTYKGKDATKGIFLENGGDFDIIHLSTHASAEDKPDASAWIAFSDAGKQNEEEFKLSLNDLYAMRLTAAMVVLSACETGRGDLARGEGVMSLARGFAYAGCQSTVTTLWQVNNQSTANIMERFYGYLKEGFSKDVALQKAKSGYLGDESVDQLGAHPYYWAAYVSIGDPEPLGFNKGSYYFIPLIIMLLLIGWVVLRRTKG